MNRVIDWAEENIPGIGPSTSPTDLGQAVAERLGMPLSMTLEPIDTFEIEALRRIDQLGDSPD
jgi:hypothetical protein